MTIPTKSLINFFSSHLLVNSLSPFAPVTWEGGGKPKIVTNGDKGGRGSKILIFAVTSFLNGPYVIQKVQIPPQVEVFGLRSTIHSKTSREPLLKIYDISWKLFRFPKFEIHVCKTNFV